VENLNEFRTLIRKGCCAVHPEKYGTLTESETAYVVSVFLPEYKTMNDLSCLLKYIGREEEMIHQERVKLLEMGLRSYDVCADGYICTDIESGEIVIFSWQDGKEVARYAQQSKTPSELACPELPGICNWPKIGG
jgi:hypothetical protein